MSIDELQNIAKRIRRLILISTTEAGSGHPGGSLSATDIITVLFFHHLAHNPKNPHWEDRDRFVLSKGHTAPALYAALALSGYFPEDDLINLRKLGSHLQGHPDMKVTPGVEMSTGSLGQGFSTAIGMALAARLDKKDYKVYVMLGDGELDEGIVWESAMSAAHFKLNNLIAIVDKNNLQIDGTTDNIMNLGDIEKKFEAFGWKTKTIDGHNYSEIIDALNEGKLNSSDKPFIIIANTVKGKGISFMENNNNYHGAALSREDLEKALEELDNGK